MHCAVEVVGLVILCLPVGKVPASLGEASRKSAICLGEVALRSTARNLRKALRARSVAFINSTSPSRRHAEPFLSLSRAARQSREHRIWVKTSSLPDVPAAC